ncbi:MAG: acetolactate synthase small subunit [Chloroflexota bacterium]
MMQTKGTPRHTVVALVQDHPGVLNRVAGLFRRRSFNIESLTVGHTHQPGVSRMTIVVDGSTTDVNQVTLQLSKLIEVIEVNEITDQPNISHDLALIKVRASGAARNEVIGIAGVFHAEVVDVGHDSVIIEVTGPEDRIDALVELLGAYGIAEMQRTGTVAMARGASMMAIER